MSEPEPEVKMVAVDGTDAVFGLIVRDTPEGEASVEVFGNGLSKPEAVALLRTLADAWDTQ